MEQQAQRSAGGVPGYGYGQQAQYGQPQEPQYGQPQEPFTQRPGPGSQADYGAPSEHGQNEPGHADERAQNHMSGGLQRQQPETTQQKGAIGTAVAGVKPTGTATPKGHIVKRGFHNDPHHHQVMHHYHKITESGMTTDHMHSLIHFGTFILAHLARESGMTMGHEVHPEDEAGQGQKQLTKNHEQKGEEQQQQQQRPLGHDQGLRNGEQYDMQQ